MKFSNLLYICCFSFILFLNAGAQSSDFLDALPPNDPIAKELINQVCSEYDNYKTFQISFLLTVKKSGFVSKEKIKGFAKGNKYRLEFKDQTMVYDGESVWRHQKSTNKIFESKHNPQKENIIFPSEMLRKFEQNYAPNLVGEFPLGEKTLKKLEFIPKASDINEFKKINVYIDQSTNQIIRISRFAKNNTLYIMDFTEPVYNLKLEDNLFKLEMS